MIDYTTSFWIWAILTAINIAVTARLLYTRGVFSAEGWCLFYLLVVEVSDAAFLLWADLTGPETLILGSQEFDLRIYPTLVHIACMIAFGVGLHLADPKPKSVGWKADQPTMDQLVFVSTWITVTGVAMFAIALLFLGASLGEQFYNNLDTYRTEALPQGGFWYRGSDVALFGLSIFLVSSSKRFSVKLIGMILLGLIPGLLTSNKGGMEKAVFFMAFALAAFRPAQFRRFIKVQVAAPLILLVVFSVGVKNFVLSWNVQQVSTRGALDSAVAAIGARYSHVGLYRGYCKMVDSLESGAAEFFGGRVITYTVSSAMPRYFLPDKTDNPFRAIGYMINPYGEVNAREVSAPTLAGTAYLDFGFAPALGILFAGGVVLGLLRRYCLRHPSVPKHIFYLFFCLFGAVSSESGFSNLIYVPLLGFGILAPVLILLRKRRRAPARTLILRRPFDAPRLHGSAAEEPPRALGSIRAT